MWWLQDECGQRGDETAQFARVVTRGDVDDIRCDVGALDLFAVSVRCLIV